MRGQTQLEATRRRGYVPEVVFIDADSKPVRRVDAMFDPLAGGAARLGLLPGESPARVDLRCVVGLVVHVSGTDANRVQAMRDAAIAAGASRVISATTERTNQGWQPFRTVELTDTAGLESWPPENVAAYRECAERIAFYGNRSRHG